MNATVKVSKTDATIRRIVSATFPEYTGRKIRLTSAETVELGGNYWDGGSRSTYRFVKLDGFASVALPAQNPMRDASTHSTPLPEGFVAVRHTVNCGIDCGLTIIANPANVAPLLPAGVAR